MTTQTDTSGVRKSHGIWTHQIVLFIINFSAGLAIVMAALETLKVALDYVSKENGVNQACQHSVPSHGVTSSAMSVGSRLNCVLVYEGVNGASFWLGRKSHCHQA